MDKIWLKSYPPGVPAEIDLTEFSSLADLFQRSCKTYASRTAYVNMGTSLTYAELERAAASFSGYLQGVLQLAQGARVALMMPNLLQYPICLFGALNGGYVVVSCNPLYTARELAHQLRDSGAEVIVIVENFAHVLQQVITENPDLPLRHVVLTSLGEMLGWAKGLLVNLVARYVKQLVPDFQLPQAVSLTRALRLGMDVTRQPVRLGHDDLAFLQYTGGTTGTAKGAMLSHGNMLANLAQAKAWLTPFLAQSKGTETIVTALPLYHIFSLTANCLTFLRLGALNVLITNPRDIPGMVKEMSRYPVSVITGVNTLFNALLHNPDFARLRFRTWRVALGGGMALQKVVAERWRQVTGIPLLEAYGLTETSPAVTINPLDLPAFNGSIGLPLPATDVAIRDDEGREVPLGEPGEICVRGPQLMQGYYQRPAETARAMSRDGYFLTGDIGVMDEHGFITIVDRKKDMILVSGFNVYPNEVEAVVAGHPGVLEVAAVGVPDEHSGEAVKLFVVKKEQTLTEDDLAAWCRSQLTGYKRPRAIEFRKELPKSNVGKILRRALRDATL